MTLFCPGCNTAIDGSAAAGLLEMNCPQCGIRFSVPTPAVADAARWGEVTTSRLAIISLVAGIGSLVLPFCLCPFMLVGFSTAAPGPPMAVGVGGAGPVMVTTVTTTTTTTTTATTTPAAPVPSPPGDAPDPVRPPEPADPADPGEPGEDGD